MLNYALIAELSELLKNNYFIKKHNSKYLKSCSSIIKIKASKNIQTNISY